MHVGVSGWIIQDGNYRDVVVGETHAFALEFWTEEPLRRSRSDKLSALWRGDCTYSVTGKVDFVGDGWWVLDAGLPMYSDRLAPPGPPGTQVTANIYVSIDHFAYFERLAKQPDAPPLIYDWRIDAIELDTTPHIETKPRFFERDLSRRSSKTVLRTDAWTDDGGDPEYILCCSRLAGPPRRVR